MAGYFTIEVSPASGPGDASYTVSCSSHDGFKGTIALSCSTATTTCALADATLMICEDETKSTTCSVGPVTEPDQLDIAGTHSGETKYASADLIP